MSRGQTQIEIHCRLPGILERAWITLLKWKMLLDHSWWIQEIGLKLREWVVFCRKTNQIKETNRLHLTIYLQRCLIKGNLRLAITSKVLKNSYKVNITNQLECLILITKWRLKIKYWSIEVQRVDSSTLPLWMQLYIESQISRMYRQHHLFKWESRIILQALSIMLVNLPDKMLTCSWCMLILIIFQRKERIWRGMSTPQ